LPWPERDGLVLSPYAIALGGAGADFLPSAGWPGGGAYSGERHVRNRAVCRIRARHSRRRAFGRAEGPAPGIDPLRDRRRSGAAKPLYDAVRADRRSALRLDGPAVAADRPHRPAGRG